MKHVGIKELLPLYIDGGLDSDEVEVIEAHLAECEECREELELYQENFAYLSSLEELEVGADFLPSLMERIQREESIQTESAKRQAPVQKKKRSGGWDWIKKLFKARVRMPVGALGLGVAAVLLILLIGPLDLLDNQPQNLAEPDQNYGNNFYMEKTNMMDQGGGIVPAPSSEQLNMRSRSLAAPNETQIQDTERKVIKTGTLEIEVKDMQKIDQNMQQLAQEMKGYISSAREWEGSSARMFSYYQLRIPDEFFTEAVNRVETMGRVISSSENSRDVTEEYIDIDSRLKNLTVQEERYRQLLQKAVDVEDILNIEQQLERVRGEIESLQGRMNYLDNQLSYSTLNVNFQEPEPITSSDQGIIRALREALSKMADTFYDMIVYLGVILPYLLVLIILYGIYWINKFMKD